MLSQWLFLAGGPESMPFRSRRTDLPGGRLLTTILASLEAFHSFSSSTASQKLRRLRGNAESPADFARSTGEAVSSTVEEIELSTLGAATTALGGVALTGGNADCDALEQKSVGMVDTIGKSAKN